MAIGEVPIWQDANALGDVLNKLTNYTAHLKRPSP